MSLRILVTGGNGFIGQHVTATLRSRGHIAVCFDRCGMGHDMPSYFGDVRDANAVSEAVYHTDGVIHLAGILGTSETVRCPRSAAETNVMGSLNVFEACALHGKLCVNITVGNHWMQNPYSISKSCAERFALMYNEERGTRIAVVRGLNAYGPGQKAKPVCKMMPNFIMRALAGEPLIVYGDGEQRMDMIYVGDIAQILADALLITHGCYDRVMEAGSGEAPTVNEIAYAVIRECESKSVIEHRPMRPGEPPHQTVRANVSTLAPLGSRGITGLAEGIAMTVPWYRRQWAG